MSRTTGVTGAAAAIIVLVTAGLAITGDNQKSDESCFSKSLHYSGEGMRYWYEKEDGLKSITGVPYGELSCQKCHAKSCDVCHVKTEGGKCSYSVQKAKDMNTCLACHARAQAAPPGAASSLPREWAPQTGATLLAFDRGRSRGNRCQSEHRSSPSEAQVPCTGRCRPECRSG